MVIVRYRQFVRVVIFAIALFTGLTLLPVPSWATDYLGSQTVNQPATLVSPKAKTPISMYLRPAPNQPAVGYGVDGASVTVMEQLASFLPEADQSTAWNHIRLNDEPFTEGWVQGKFLVILDHRVDAETEETR